MRKKTLTLREKALVREVTRTDEGRPKSNTEAYRRAYEITNPNTRTVTNEVSRILRKPHVALAVEEAERAIEANRRRASRGNALAIQIALWKEAENADTAKDRIAALRALTSLLPKDALEEDTKVDSANTKQQLLDELNNILSSSIPDTIDVSRSEVDLEDVVADAVEEAEEVFMVEAEIIDPEC